MIYQLFAKPFLSEIDNINTRKKLEYESIQQILFVSFYYTPGLSISIFIYCLCWDMGVLILNYKRAGIPELEEQIYMIPTTINIHHQSLRNCMQQGINHLES